MQFLPTYTKKWIAMALLLFYIGANAEYSASYDDQLDQLILTKPEQALKQAQYNLKQAELKGEVKKQLIALLYMSNALDVMARSQEYEQVINKGLILANNNNNTRFRSEFTALSAYQFELKGDYQQALFTANKALQLANETNDERIIAENRALRGQIQLAIDNYDMALKDVESAIAIFKVHEDKDNLSLNYNLYAIIYDALGEYDNAIKYYLESLSYDQYSSPYNTAVVYFNIGSAYVSKEDYTKAMEYYQKAKALTMQTNHNYTLSFISYGMAEVLIKQGKLDLAQSLLLKVYESFEKNKDILMLFNSNLLIAEIKIKNIQYTQALHYLVKAEAQSKTMDTPRNHLNYINQKIDYFKALNMWEQAFDAKNQADNIEDEVNIKEREKLVSELKIRFNAQFDQEKLELLQHQNKLQSDSIGQQKTMQKYLIGLIVLGVIVILITFAGYINQRKTKRHLYKLSITDYLTDVANRRHIIQELEKLQQSSLRHELVFSLVMIDLDFFKDINDTYGHDIGNEVLMYFAKTAKSVIKTPGQIGRIGGEEWLLLLPHFTKDETQELLSELRDRYRDGLSLKIPKECQPSFSSGAVLCTGQYSNFEQMLTDVDKAMYKAKKKGREQDVFIREITYF